MDDATPTLRPLERLQRPAPTTTEDAEYRALAEELDVSIEAMLAQVDSSPRPSQPIQNQPLLPVVPRAVPPSVLVSEPRPRQQRAGQPPRRPRSRQRRRLLIVLLAVPVVIAVVVGTATALRSDNKPHPAAPATSHQPAPSSDTHEVTDAEWDQALQQWHCTLQQYQAAQSGQSNTAKDTSCAK